jgi:hypothetical protein
MWEWVEGSCRQGIEVDVASTIDAACARRNERQKRMDDHRDFKCTGTDRERGRAEENIEGEWGWGANQRGRMTEATRRQQMMGRKPCMLYGFSDGSMSGDRNYGGYSWVLVLRSPQHPMGKVVSWEEEGWKRQLLMAMYR